MRGRKTQANEQSKRLTVGYIRVSTDTQAEHGVSLAVQRVRIAAYAAAMGFALDEVIEDAGASAKTLQRPGMTQILQGVRAGRIGRVIIVKRDRATRSLKDLGSILELFAKHDAALVSVSEHMDTSSAAGRMVVNMLGVVATWEREAIAERTASALAHKRASGCVYGPVPYGYRRVGKTLIADPDAQAALEVIREMHREGSGASLRQIAAELSRRGIKPSRAQVWHGSSVRAIIQSVAYKAAVAGLKDGAA